jgi:DNA-binding NarL/FixJ family response regulator
MSASIKIVLVDDEELFRKGVSLLLEKEKNIDIVFEAANGEELVNYLKSCTDYPDIILMDLNIPVLNGVEATKIIHKQFPVIRVIALTSYNTKSFIANMIHIGASSYLVKNATPQEMIHTINQVFEKGFYYNEKVMQVIQEDILVAKTHTRSRFDSDFLTKREKEILQLICEQDSSTEIAKKLFISPRTVEGHRNNLLLKTDSKNIAGLVVFAIQNKIVELS